MKRVTFLIIVSVFFAALGANAEVKNLDAIMAKATSQETKDLGNLLKQIRIVPTKDPNTGASVFKVMAVEEGSVYDREGVRVGDLVSTGSMGNSSKPMKSRVQ